MRGMKGLNVATGPAHLVEKSSSLPFGLKRGYWSNLIIQKRDSNYAPAGELNITRPLVTTAGHGIHFPITSDSLFCTDWLNDWLLKKKKKKMKSKWKRAREKCCRVVETTCCFFFKVLQNVLQTCFFRRFCRTVQPCSWTWWWTWARPTVTTQAWWNITHVSK